MKNSYKLFHRRNLPHITPKDTPLFITYHLDFQFPPELRHKLLEKKKNYVLNKQLSKEEFFSFEIQIFKEFEELIERKNISPNWLADPSLAQIVFDSLLYGKNKYYDLHCFCVMSSHVHVLLTLLNDNKNTPYALPYIMQNHKRFTARECNKILNRHGKFWLSEYYDHYCRSDNEFQAFVWYILRNPVKAKLCTNWQDWKFTWIDEKLRNEIEP